jgi:methionyl aminopeptidase
MTKLHILCLATAAVLSANAFSPPTSCSKVGTSTQLFMNKKKSKKKTTGQGFGSAVGMASGPSFPYAGSVQPGKISPQRVVMSENIAMPDYAMDGVPKKKSSSLLPWVIEVKKPDEIEKMRSAGKLARDILDLAGRAVAVGVTTDEIDTIVHEAVVKVSG